LRSLFICLSDDLRRPRSQPEVSEDDISTVSIAEAGHGASGRGSKRGPESVSGSSRGKSSRR